MYIWDINEPSQARQWDLCGLLVYSETVEQNYDFMKLQATIPTYNEKGDPDGTETKLVLSGPDVKSLMLRKYWTFKFLTGKYYNYTSNQIEDLVTTVGGAWTSLKKAYQTWLADNQIWVNKIAQALNILDNPADNYNKHLHSTLTYKGSEKETWEPKGKERTTFTPKGSESDTLSKEGKETNTFSKGPEQRDHYKTTYNDDTALLTDRDELKGTNGVAYTDKNELSFSTNREDTNTHKFSNDRKDETLKEFLETRKDETTKEFTNRFDDYILHEWGNIGVTTYAQILTGIFGIANTAQLGDYLVNDFIHRNCIK